MSRNINTATLAALQSGNMRLGLLMSMETSSGTTYAWTGTESIIYNGNTYPGLGTLINISAIPESNTVIAQGVTLTLNGVDPTTVSEALTDIPQGGAVYIYLALLNPDNSIIGEPITSFSGQTDGIVIEDNPDGTCSISVDVENRLTQLQRDRTYRWTMAQQAELFPGDQGFLYTANLQDYVSLWGASQ